jgi:hypothetical protein
MDRLLIDTEPVWRVDEARVFTGPGGGPTGRDGFGTIGHRTGGGVAPTRVDAAAGIGVAIASPGGARP